MTVDEELERLADNLRRLKIEYDAFFNGGRLRPPNVLIARVEKIIHQYGGGNVELNFRQRFRFSQLAQSYFANKNLWRRKLQAREEGSVAERPHKPVAVEDPFSITWADPDREPEKVNQLLEAVIRARSRAGETTAEFELERFTEFIREKTRRFKQSLGCDRIQFTVTLENGRVKLRATKAGNRE